MAEVVLFHHVQGLTAGVVEFADRIRAGGHTVHTPDFFHGHTYASIDEGFAALQGKGPGALMVWADNVVSFLPKDIVYCGISLGVMPAQRFAQTRPEARGAIFLEACAPPAEFGTWPAEVPVQVHGMDGDLFFAGEGDLVSAQAVCELSDEGTLFTYAGSTHLFTDSSLPSFDPTATDLVVARMLHFLAHV